VRRKNALFGAIIYLMKTYQILLLFLLLSFSGHTQSLYFPPSTGSTWDTLSPSSLGWCQTKIDSLYRFLEAKNSNAFILLKDGKIVLEKYFGTFTQSDPWQWASAGKTLTSFMVGVAQQEGYLTLSDSTSTNLGKGWTSTAPAQEGKITIRHQLTMTSGLDDGVTDPYCTLANCLVYKSDAGTRWAYHNAPYTLLDGVIEQATGRSLNVYMTQKLKTPTGMTGAFFPVDYNHVYFSNARSMARFGLLMLNKGSWNGTHILRDTTYFNQMISTSQQLNKSYGYLWWLNGKESYKVPQSQLTFNGPLNPHAPNDLFVAMGKDGQFLNIVPSQEMVWLRMGEAPDGLEVPFLLNDEIWANINALDCSPLAIEEPILKPLLPILYPNPANDVLKLRRPSSIERVVFYNVYGDVIKTILTVGNELSIEELDAGSYLAKFFLTNGEVSTQKIIVTD